MDLPEHLKALSHHAYCIIGGRAEHDELVSILAKKHKIQAPGNPDFFDRTYETFTIDDAREVKASANMMPVSSAGKKIFMLRMKGITSEAQNALLKTLEEPPAYVHIFLIIPSAHLLLPTVKSRLAMIGDARQGAADGAVAKDATSFLAMNTVKRLDSVKKLMDEIAKEKRPKQDAVDLINAIQEAVYAKGMKANAAKLEAIEVARTYMNDRAPSMKMLLEYVALNV